MQVLFWASNKSRVLQTRRGSKIFRKVDVRPGTNSYEYKGLAHSVLELLEDNVVVGSHEIIFNIPPKIQLVPTKEHVDVKFTYRPSESQVSNGPEKKDDDNLQPLGKASGNDGGTVSGPVLVQTPPVDGGNARLSGTDEHRPEVGADGVHGDSAESESVHGGRVGGVGSVSSANEDTGRDGLLINEVRPATGEQPAPSEDVQRREERGDETGRISRPVYPWEQQSSGT